MKTPRLPYKPHANHLGQGLTEYLTLLLLVALLSVAATRSLGKTIRTKIKSARNQIHREVTSRDSRPDRSSWLDHRDPEDEAGQDEETTE